MNTSAVAGNDVPPTSDSTSLSLLQRVRTHDPDAWRRLVEFHGPVVYGWCRRCGLQPDDAADVLQEVFVAVNRRIGDFRRERPGDSFRGWLWTIAQHKIQDWFRARHGQPTAAGGTDAQLRMLRVAEPPPPSDESAASGDAGDGALAPGLEALRGEFEPRTWQAFWQTAVAELPAAQVAAELGMTVNAVRKAKCRVLARLRAEFHGLIE